VGSGIAFAGHLDSAAPPVFADACEGLERAIANIATNARDAMPDGGTFTFETEQVGGTVEIRLSDTSRGIDSAVADRIFERGLTTEGERGGDRIGPKNVRVLVERSGGTVRFASEPGRGAIFTIALPAYWGAGSACGERAGGVPASRSRRPRSVASHGTLPAAARRAGSWRLAATRQPGNQNGHHRM
jgi:nitrogen-specific signal transduction histidine kinase